MSRLRMAITRCAVGILLTAAANSAQAAWKSGTLENEFAAERQRAIAENGRVAARRPEVHAAAQQLAAATGEEIRAAKAHLADLQNELVSALAQYEPGILKAAQAEIAAWQTRLEVADGEQALALKRTEETDREAEAWTKRAATIELALRLEMRTLLANRAEIESREKRVENARKDVEYQQSQIAKYTSRRQNAALKWQEYHARLAAVAARPRSPAQDRLTAALDEETRQLRRGLRLQEDWFLFNKTLEDRSRRNLAFAHTDVAVNETYAAALDRKALQQRAAEAGILADEADALLSATRVAAEARLATVSQELAAAGKEADAALRAIGAAREDELREAARADYSLALEQRGRWEAESEFITEFIARQKAVAAFSREKADRVRSLAEDRDIEQLAHERDALLESARTSEQYVRSFTSMLQKLDNQIEDARRTASLGEAETVALQAQVRSVTVELAATRPQAPHVLCGRLLIAAARAGGGTAPTPRVGRRAAVIELVFRAAQRTLAQERLSIAQDWLANTRNAIEDIERTMAGRLWEHHDPRLTWRSVLELGECLAAAAADGGFILESYAVGLGKKQGYASPWRVATGALVVLLLIAAGAWLRFRLQPLSGRAVYWLAGHVAPFLLPLTASGVFLLTYFPHNRLALLLGLALPLAGLAHLAWCLLLLFCPRHHCPPRQTLTGGLLAAVRLVLISGAGVLALALFCRQADNPWNLECLLLHGWWLFVWVAAIRFTLHPLLLGRLLSRRSEDRGIRVLGAGIAFACVAVMALVAILYLISLDSLAQSTLRIVTLSLAVVLASFAANRFLGWLFRRVAARGAKLAQMGVCVAATAAVAELWWRLVSNIFLSPNAPAAIRDAAHMARHAWHLLLAFWHHQVAIGMTVRSLTCGVLVFTLSFWVSRRLKRLFLRRVLSRTPMDDATRQTFGSILGYLIIVVGFLVGLNVAGSSIQNLALLAGAITVGIGFGLQNVINNFVSSLLIHFGRTIRVGDFIEAGGQRGTVQEIGLRNTRMLTEDGITVLVPNGSFISSNIINWTYPSPRTRLHVPVTIARQGDLAEATRLLTEVALAHSLLVPTPRPAVEVRAVTATAITLDLLAWTDRPQQLASIVGDVSLEADRRLREKGLLL